MNREVSVTKRVRTAKGLRYCPVVFSANGRIKPDYVLVNGKPERHTEGSYYISWYSGTKLNRVSVGKDAATATARHQQKTAELNAINNGVAVLSDDAAADNEHRPAPRLRTRLTTISTRSSSRRSRRPWLPTPRHSNTSKSLATSSISSRSTAKTC